MFDFGGGRGCALDPVVGANSVLPLPIGGFKGAYCSLSFTVTAAYLLMRPYIRPMAHYTVI